MSGDGRKDVIVHFVTVGAGGSATSVAALLGTSLGSFGVGAVSPASTAAGDEPAQVAVADFDGDQKSDLLVTSRFNAWVQLGNGAGVFATAVMVASGTGSKSLLRRWRS